MSLMKIGLGTWAFGGRAYGPMDDSVALAVTQRAYDLGIRFFDTANVYAAGRSEEILGEALADRPDAQICTKIGYDISSGKAIKKYDIEFLENALAISMKRLRRSQVDMLLLHNPPTEVLEREEIFNWLNLAVARGQIVHWGVSVYDSVSDAKLALAGGAQAIEARYSLFRRDVIEDLKTSNWEFDFIARSPFDSGLLTGKYSGNETFPATDHRSAMKKEVIQNYVKATAEFKALIANGTVHSLAELAIRFSAFGKNVNVVIPGAKSIEQLEANINAATKGPLPAPALELIEQVREKYFSERTSI